MKLIVFEYFHSHDKSDAMIVLLIKTKEIDTF